MKGFTLVELSIVLVIIGLIVGGVLVGQELVRISELRAVIKETDSFKTSIRTFEGKYNYLPGDIPTANRIWSDCTDFVSNLCNGDGNGYIDTGFEDIRAWQHLSLAGVLPGEHTGLVASPGVRVPGVNIPTSKIGGGYILYYDTGFWSDFPPSTRNIISSGNSGYFDSYIGCGNIDPFGAQFIDEKLTTASLDKALCKALVTVQTVVA